MGLDQAGKARVRAALAKGNPASLTSPEEVHQFALHVNWDGGTAALARALEHPACDRGTALAVLWLGEPDYAFSRYASLAEVEASRDVNRDEIRFLVSIVERLAREAWPRATIRFTPPAISTDWKWSVPAVVTTPSPGADHPLEVLDDVAYAPLDDEDRAVIAKATKAVITALKKAGIALDPSAPPDAVVAVLHRAMLDAAAGTLTLTKPAMRAMGFVFADQLHRAFGGAWYARHANGDRELYVCSKDRAILVGASRVGASAVENRSYFSLEGLFRAFGKVVDCGADFASVLSPEESAHLYKGRPGTWPVWGVHWKLPPWP